MIGQEFSCPISRLRIKALPIPNIAEVKEDKKAIEKLDTIYLSKDKQILYEAEKKKLMDEQEEIRTAEERGVEKGRIETAKNLMELDVSMDVIIEATGLNREEIEEL